MEQVHQHGHDHHHAAAQPAAYSIDTDNHQLPVAEPATFSFRVRNPQGEVVSDFGVTHEKPMHFIVVHKDLSSFQHLHPELDAATATFTVRDILLPKPGTYRVFADFVDSSTHPGHAMSALGQGDITGGDHHAALHEPLDEPQPSYDLAGGYSVHLACPVTLRSGQDAALEFRIERNGQPITDLEDYVGAKGHAVILSEGSLNFIHAHPMESSPSDTAVVFHTTFPEPGNYKVFAQFQHKGEVLTAPFVLHVS